MEVNKTLTDTYVLTGIDRLDPVYVYVTNYKKGEGKFTIDCYGEAWTCYFGAMGERNIQEFVVNSDNDYLAGKMLKETRQTDFASINEVAQKRGYDISVSTDVEIAMAAKDMAECFGEDWYMDLPRCHTSEYEYLCRILNSVKAAFYTEL